MQKLTKHFLKRRYIREKKSARDISQEFGCSENKIHYWLDKYKLPKRSISDAVYVKSNPKGDPFLFVQPHSPESWFLYGLGLGLYWGEGNKANKTAVRLGNTDPDLIKKFLTFLAQVYQIDSQRLHFGLQIFSDTRPEDALRYWIRTLGVERSRFQKVVVTKSGKLGTYRNKNKNGVLTVYFSNVKLRDSIVSAIEGLRNK